MPRDPAAARPDAARSGPRSDAIDLAGVVLAGGHRISVARDWRGPDDASAFLRAIHRGACRFFDVVLGPGHDAAHADHLHFDRGPARACR